MNTKLDAPWLFVIDTEDYAGNFERELCAYITGRVGECEVGDEESAIFVHEVGPPFENIIDEADEDGCRRPVTIYPTPNYYNDGMGGYYKVGQEVEALVAYRKKAAAYHRNGMGVQYLKRWRDGNNVEGLIDAGWTEEKLIKSAEKDEEAAVKAEQTKKLGQYPVYNSVAISFSEKPTTELIELMKTRSYSFAEMKNEYNDKPRISKITGFRLIENIVKRSTISTDV